MAAFREKAAALGFDGVGITHVDAIPEAPSRLRAFLEAGYHADLDWMEETEERRANPHVLWPEARSILMLAMTYGPDREPLENLAHPERGNISVYSRHRDYHDVIKGRLKELASFLVSRAHDDIDVKVFVDTAPVMEKPLAQAAGLGWQGKHTNLVSRQIGSWFFLGSIFTTLELEPDESEQNHCGKCQACVSSCPTEAFPAPYQLDARRCISYLTIEHKGAIPRDLRAAMGNRIYGCDDCLAACPWNKFAKAAHEAKLVAREDLTAPQLSDFLALDDPTFRKFFSGSPIKRIGRDRFLRNVLIATGNSGNAAYLEQVTDLLDDPSALVRGAAVWALSRLAGKERFRLEREARLPQEVEESVKAEWREADLCKA